MTDFKHVNKLLQETTDEYEARKLIEDVENFFKILDENVDAVNNRKTGQALAMEARKVAQMTPEQCQALLNDMDALKRELKTTNERMSQQMKAANPSSGSQFMMILKQILFMTGASWLIQKVASGIGVLWGKFKNSNLLSWARPYLPIVLTSLVAGSIIFIILKFFIKKFKKQDQNISESYAYDIDFLSEAFDYDVILNESVNGSSEELLNTCNKNLVLNGNNAALADIIGGRISNKVYETTSDAIYSTLNVKAGMVGQNAAA